MVRYERVCRQTSHRGDSPSNCSWWTNGNAATRLWPAWLVDDVWLNIWIPHASKTNPFILSLHHAVGSLTGHRMDSCSGGTQSIQLNKAANFILCELKRPKDTKTLAQWTWKVNYSVAVQSTPAQPLRPCGSNLNVNRVDGWCSKSGQVASSSLSVTLSQSIDDSSYFYHHFANKLQLIV